jgi:enoyl-CoA hydratase/carnithine racemase
MADAVVTVSRAADGVALVHLNRPPANSYDRAFLDDLNAAVDEVRWDETIRGAVLVSDLPGFFSAGADVANFRRSSQQQRVMTVLHAHELLLKIERTPKVVVAALAGHALGGGLEIALACDLRFAAAGDYRIGLPEVALGLLPGNGGTQRLPRLIGRARALDLMVTGTAVGPGRALELGIVDRLYPADRLVQEAVAYVARLAQGPGLAIGAIKVATRLGADLPLEGGLALEREAVWRLFMSQDAAEGLAAFGEKRPPRWTGHERGRRPRGACSGACSPDGSRGLLAALAGGRACPARAEPEQAPRRAEGPEQAPRGQRPSKSREGPNGPEQAPRAVRRASPSTRSCAGRGRRAGRRRCS